MNTCILQLLTNQFFLFCSYSYLFLAQFWNNLKYIDVYLNRSRIKIFYRSDYQSDEKILDDFTYYLNSTSFFSQTKEIKISSIKDGIYQSTGYIKQINYSQSIDARFTPCQRLQKMAENNQCFYDD